MIEHMGSAVGPAAVAGGAARPGAEGIVSRPRLFGRLGAARVSVVSAPPGSGKTVLLRSWISDAGLDERAAWVPAGRDQHDPQRFWLSGLAALRQTGPGSVLVQPLTAAPDLDGWVIAERLLKDLDAEPVEVGRAALDGGVALTQLGPSDGCGLEQLFFELTAKEAA